MIVLGIDPGLSAMGYGLIEMGERSLALVDSGTIRTAPKVQFPDRLSYLYREVSRVIAEYRPEALVMEKPIYCQNMKTALVLGQAGGMAILAAAEAGVELHEFTPLEVKKAITGKGGASKEQVQKMVKVLVGMNETIADEHISDALACAVCFAHSRKLLNWRKQTARMGKQRNAK